MSKLLKQIAGLSPAKRELLAAKLGKLQTKDLRKADIARREASASPLSFAQERLWFLNQMEPESRSYNIYQAYRLEGALDAEVLQRSLQSVVSRHKVLSAVFRTIDGKAEQVGTFEEKFGFVYEDLQLLAEPEKETKANQLIEQYSQLNFDLEQGPLFRALLVQMGRNEHILLIVFHHIVFDGASLGIFFQELATAYKHLKHGTPSAPELPFQYSDYAVWQREQLNEKRIPTLVDRWKQILGDAPHELDLMTDRPRPAVQTNNGGIELMELSPKLSDQIRQLGNAHSATLFMVMSAAFNVMLWQCTGQNEILIGTPVSGRTHPDTEALIGLFVNTMVLRTDLTGDPTFAELLVRVRSSALESVSLQELPFEKLVDGLKLQRSLSRPPLFQVMLSVQNATGTLPQFPDVTVSRVPIARGTSLFDLELVVSELDSGIRLALEYNSDLFESVTIQKMLQQISSVLEAASSSAETRISQLPLMTAESYERALEMWEPAEPTLAQSWRIHELFEAQAQRTPTAIAVESSSASLTYRELNEQANQLSHYLRTVGAGPEVMVAVMLERSLDSLICLLGVLKAGAVYVPVDVGLPSTRIEFLLQNSGAALVLTHTAHAGKLYDSSARVICIDQHREQISECSVQDLANAVSPRGLAYVIYTSGSTGQPKGVAVEHHAAMVHLPAIQEEFDYRNSDRVLQFASLSFDVSIEQMLAPLFAGATVVLKEDEPWGADEFVTAVRDRRLTVMNVPPAFWSQVARHKGLNKLIPDPLRLVILGGDKLSVETVLHWQQGQHKTAELLNAYGPTETVITSTIHRVPDQFTGNEEIQRVPIGRPVAQRKVYIVNQHGHLVPVGMWGELLFGGESVARGYLNQPDLTADRFVPDCFSGARGERLYRSGDKGRWREDGVLEYLGRMDDQVKVRGYRIELGEVERGVQAEAGKHQVAVAVKERCGSNDLQLVAYVECGDESGTAVVLNEIREGVKKRLPEYMCPGVYVAVERLPWNKSGKVDRNALPEPESVVSEEKGEYRAPSNEVEEKLAEIWAAVLGRGPIGVRSNFFELGGDSIVGIQIVARARQAGIELTPKQLFQHQTIEELARAAGVKGKRVEAEQGEVKGKARLTPIQEWYFQQKSDNRNHYNQGFLFEVGADVKQEWLEQVLSKLVDQHDALRLRFEREGSSWVQRYASVSETALAIEHADISGLTTKTEQDRELRKLVEEQHKKLNIEHGPVVRAAWIELGKERGRRLLLAAHHLVIDGVSWRILLEDVEQWYGQLSAGKELKDLKSPAKTTSYKQWAEELVKYAVSPGAEAEGKYWEEQENVPVESLYEDNPTGANSVGDEGRVVRVLEEEQTSQLLREASQAYNTQVMDLLLSAMVGGLKNWQGQERIRVEAEGHGREEVMAGVDLTRTVGWFTSVYPVVLEWKAGEGIGERIKRVKEQLREIPQRGIGYGVLRYLGGRKWVDRLEGSSELLVNYLGQFDQAMGKGALLQAATEGSGTALSAGTERSSKLDLNALVVGGRLQMMWSYSQKRYKRETVEALAEAYETSLLEIIHHCLKPNSSLSINQFDDITIDQNELEYLVGKLSGAAR